MTVEELLAEHSAAVADLTEQLRSLVRKALPTAEERVSRGWHGLGYHQPDRGYVLGILPRRDTVRLLFEHGHLLPQDAFTGGGSQTRWVEVAEWDDALAGRLRDLVELAAAE